jgi:dipeptidyl aminopeptidase/acylaminoacyl peptidase
MKKILFILLLSPIVSFAQKKPLDHTVYDSWQSIGEKLISANGKFVAYTINVQEGDGNLIIQSTKGEKFIEVERGYNITITEDDKFVVFKIKPSYKQTRDAKIAKKKADDMPKDSLGIYDIENKKLEKIARVKNYKTPEKAAGWLAYLMEKPLAEIKEKKELDSLGKLNELNTKATQLQKQIDSLKTLVTKAQEQGINILSPKVDTTPKPKKEEDIEEGTELVLRNLKDGKEQKIKLSSEYLFSKNGSKLLVETTKKNGNSKSKALVILIDLVQQKKDTILTGFNDSKQYSFDTTGNQIAFVAERDSTKKESQKFYRLFYYKTGLDSAQMLAYKTTAGIPNNWTISENGNVSFSESGKRLFFGTAPILIPKDTSLPEFERVSVDVWHYNDDDLMTAQLKNLDRILKKSYLARFDFENNKVIQLGNESLETVVPTFEGDGAVFYAISDEGKRVAAQWQGFTKKDIYKMNPITGESKKIIENLKGNIYPSYTGNYLLYYDEIKRNYSCYSSSTQKITQVAKDIPYKLFDEENDMPDDPNAYGIVKWMQDDAYVLIYDRYDIWKVDPKGIEKSVCITNGRKDKIVYRYVTVDNEEKFIKQGQEMIYQTFNENNKISSYSNVFIGVLESKTQKEFSKLNRIEEKNRISNFIKAKKSLVFIFQTENYKNSPNLYTSLNADTSEIADYPTLNSEGRYSAIRYKQLSELNPQQSNYFWGSAELFEWKAYTGKLTEGVLYKPENFDSTKKYPMIVYFYERLNQTLHQYQAPAPTPSRLNIPYFVSNGYVVFVPDIWYTNGHPGKSAYDYIVSGTRALIKKGFIDSTKIGLQGQSWGGYQIAYLITQTNLYKAAWAGAPVANMFSAYGGIRWESGINRQFQYEKSQSRIGATIWEKPNLYIENSPLFHIPKITTPLVIMANDADGAVPWYQGIEMFTAMRRLNKPVWMLNYNGEAHNLVERKNRKDIQIREQQFFDWLLKGDKPAKWLSEGVPAIMKGRDLGLKN